MTTQLTSCRQLGVWPPQSGRRITQLLPDCIALKAAPVFINKIFDCSSRSCAVGQGECGRTTAPGCDTPAEFARTMLFPAPAKWAEDASLTFSVQSLPTFSWRYNSLEEVVRAICPQHGMAAFVNVRERSHLLDVPFPVGRYQPNQYNVSVAAPVGVMIAVARGFQIGDQVCIISERAREYGVVANGQPLIRFVSKRKLLVVAPILVEHNINRELNLRIRFKRSTLDHYDFCT
eukprot:TRINITY_DN8898_c0_g1_i3.p1 TRINITY_DN8898_c0_g1~~TRINITY_DN8898_c0_g1_i3.p1  ORF type:complete len:233 (+),score=26.04 TRINITY_DN8898_c0_g1_i3:648-1346(+)